MKRSLIAGALLCALGVSGCQSTGEIHAGGSVGGLAAQYARSGGGYASGAYYSADTLILAQPNTRIDPNANFGFHAARGSTPQSSAFLSGFMQGAMPQCVQNAVRAQAWSSSSVTTVTGAQIQAACPGRY